MTEPLAIYVHWPFCLSKCPYCDFNSHVRQTIDDAGWRGALLAELDHYANETTGRRVSSIFFGGGTPSLMGPATAAAVIDRVALRWALDSDAEITLEANPSSVESGRFRGFRAAGVNRASLGVQALDDAALRFLGRGHSADEAVEAVRLAARCFPRFSFDLIYARPGQTVAGWLDELGRALALAGDHLSAYQLSFEEGTPFAGAARRGAIVPPDDELCAELFEETGAALSRAGLAAYETSNHARPGAECRHNLTYWRSGDYLGVGPGAHGRLTAAGRTVATRQIRGPEAWQAAVAAHGHGTDERTALSETERVEETLMMGLRLAEGIGAERFLSRCGVALGDAVDAAGLAVLRAGGFVDYDAAGLRATPAGRQRLNAVLARLIRQ